jgi:hypothetical protein
MRLLRYGLRALTVRAGTLEGNFEENFEENFYASVSRAVTVKGSQFFTRSLCVGSFVSACFAASADFCFASVDM